MTDTLSISKFPKICLFCLLESAELELISETPSVEIFWKVSGVQVKVFVLKFQANNCLIIVIIISNFVTFN